MNRTYVAIYDIVKQIPKGKVATYGQVAEIVGNKNLCRTVGNALHVNPDSAHIPCHRVVNCKGRLAENYAFGGMKKQKERLIAEGVQVNENKVELSRYQWKRKGLDAGKEGEE